MSKSGRKSGGRSRSITADEAELWEQVTRNVDLVKAKRRVTTAPAPSSEPAATPMPSAGNRRTPAAARKPGAPATPPPKPPPPPAPLAELDRRKARQIASGRIEVDDRIDLHGSRQGDARARLRAFLRSSQAKGHRTVLVITGKGDAERADAFGALLGESQRGVIRRSIPQWLEEPDLRAVVLSYAQASPRHGGAGALYVQLRKARE